MGFWHGSARICQCPTHANTRTPALSLSDAGLGRLLAYCHTACAFMALLDALRGLGLVEGRGTYTAPMLPIWSG